MTDLPFQMLGEPIDDGLLIVSDHASNRVPSCIDLGIDASQFNQHIAWDIGVADVAARIVDFYPCSAFLGNVSRLVTDFNRSPDELDVIPVKSDGLVIRGNLLQPNERQQRIDRYFVPYHDRLSLILEKHRPSLILSIHSFTPQLSSQPEEKRPWEVGVLYNESEAPSKLGIRFLQETGVIVGDQLPYSGKLLNATMNRHAEANNIPYIGIELRQDEVSDPAGQERFARILIKMCHYVSEGLGLGLQKP